MLLREGIYLRVVIANLVERNSSWDPLLIYFDIDERYGKFVGRGRLKGFDL